jgi:hypothetical protein
MPAHLKSFMRNSDVYKKKKIIKCPFWSLKIRGVTLRLRRRGFNDRISNDLNFMPSASTNG